MSVIDKIMTGIDLSVIIIDHLINLNRSFQRSFSIIIIINFDHQTIKNLDDMNDSSRIMIKSDNQIDEMNNQND